MPTRLRFRAGFAASTNLAREAAAVSVLALIDLAAVILSLSLAFATRIYLFSWILPGLSGELLSDTFKNIWWLPLVVLLALAYERLYMRRLPFWTEVKIILRSLTLALAIAITILYLSKLSQDISRPLVVLTWLASLFLVPLFRYCGKLLLIRLGLWKRAVLLVGSGEKASLVARALNREKTMGYFIVGALTEGDDPHKSASSASQSLIPILGTLNDVERAIGETGVREVIMVPQGLPPGRVVELSNRLLLKVNNLILVPDLFGLPMSGIEATSFLEEQALLLHMHNRLKSSLNRAVKRAFDLTAGTLMLLLVCPLLFLIAAALVFDSRGQVFFFQERLGQRGRTFTCIKFRTMYPGNDALLKEHLAADSGACREWATYNKLRGYDPRVTRVGRLLRKFSLDELPQLMNVILGQMSLVGPRPYLPREKEQMGHMLNDILVAKPGLTGLWQVSGRNGIHFAGRLRLDVLYMRNWSLWLDTVVLVKTVGVVVNGNGAH